MPISGEGSSKHPPLTPNSPPEATPELSPWLWANPVVCKLGSRDSGGDQRQWQERVTDQEKSHPGTGLCSCFNQNGPFGGRGESLMNWQDFTVDVIEEGEPGQTKIGNSCVKASKPRMGAQ